MLTANKENIITTAVMTEIKAWLLVLYSLPTIKQKMEICLLKTVNKKKHFV